MSGDQRTAESMIEPMGATADSPSTGLTPEAQRIRDTIDMHEFGVGLYRQRMRREHPDASESEIAAMTRAWLLAPPHPDRLRAALGDAAW